MRPVAAIVMTVGLTGAAAGLAGQDVLAGWGGSWTGSYRGPSGEGSLALEIRIDSTGAAAASARFQTDDGPTTARLEELVLRPDSLAARLHFNGVMARMRGALTHPARLRRGRKASPVGPTRSVRTYQQTLRASMTVE